MANLLGVTNPVPRYDNANVNRSIPTSANDTHIQNIPDPTRVGRPDARTDRQDSGQMSNPANIRYESNFQTFLQRLRETPELAEPLSRLLMNRQATSNLSEGISSDFSSLLELFPMDEAQLAAFLQEQLQSGTRFSGALFNLLRNAYSATQSSGMRTDILQFLKHYIDYSSTSHIEGNIVRELSGMLQSMPRSWGGQLSELVAQLQNSLASGDRSGSLRLLQQQIFPLMSQYVARTHDMGKPRSLLTLLALDVARYENGSEENLLQAFHRLSSYAGLGDKLTGLGDDALLHALKNTAFSRAALNNGFSGRFAEIAARALTGSDGMDMQEGFRTIVSAMLVNESVYMPLQHLIVPLQWQGQFLFSEIWIDPDEHKNERSAEKPRTLRLLLKMDIQDLGLFELVLSNRENDVELQVFCPERVTPFLKTMESALTDILTANGLTAKSLQVSKRVRPLVISEVFPRLFEGKEGINVKI